MLAVETFALLRATIELRGAYHEVLAEAGVTPREWDRAERHWFEALSEPDASPELVARYLDAYRVALGDDAPILTSEAPKAATTIAARSPVALGAIPLGAVPTPVATVTDAHVAAAPVPAAPIASAPATRPRDLPSYLAAPALLAPPVGAQRPLGSLGRAPPPPHTPAAFASPGPMLPSQPAVPLAP
ncbi:MAG TPA: hypothetical protein VL400_06185, partial [Polyangiaceae bacterium]|nr:hypothetical protein [Polyangiaceae bacterium]